MKQVNVGILGATGAVGQEMIKILEERNFPVASLRPIASARSAGSKIMFRGQECTIVEASDDAFEGLDIVLGAAENDIAERFAPSIVKAGAVFVDNSSAFRLDPNVPLVIPEINPEDVKWHKGIISNPNCTTIVTLVAINALAKESPIETIIASSYQAVSGAGKGGIDELNNEVKALSEGKHLEPKVFQYQIAYNIIPQIGGEAFEGYTSEEMKMQNEGRKILHLPEMKVSCTCARVPVIRSHSVSVVLRTKEKISVERAKELIANAPGCKLVDDLKNKVYPMPLDTSDQDIVYVGRIREDLTDERGLNLWCCGDQVRKGAATNAVQIAELNYLDTIELAYSGAQIIHPKTIKPLQNKNIPLYVRPFGDKRKPGTVIRAMSAPVDVPILILKKDQVLLTIRSRDFSFVLEEKFATIFSLLERFRIKANLIHNSAVNLSLCVDNSWHIDEAVAALREAGFDVMKAERMELLTIRGYTDDLWRRYARGPQVFIRQATQSTVRVVRKRD
mgnify:CR=1 FL=1